jgi:hypothetical protein
MGIASYGGHASKVNYLGLGKINPLTDVDAGDICRVAGDLTAVGRTAPFLSMTLTAQDTAVLAPLVHSVQIMSSDAYTVDYTGSSPPSGMPTVTRVSNGVILVTLASTYADDFGAVGTMTIEHAGGGAHGSVMCTVQPDILTASTCRFYMFDAAGAALVDKKITVWVA